MMPLEAALSSLREATFRASPAASASPAETAVRTLRTWVLSSDFTARLRSRAFSFVLFRLIWDLMFATKTLLWCCVGGSSAAAEDRPRRGPAVGTRLETSVPGRCHGYSLGSHGPPHPDTVG